jgi:hypothetical protein
VVELDPLRAHAGKPARVHLAGREHRVLDHDDAHAAILEADRRLRHAHVGLEADQHGGPPTSALDPLDDLGRAREAEGRLDERRRIREQPGDRSERPAVAVGVLLGQHGGHAEPAGNP